MHKESIFSVEAVKRQKQQAEIEKSRTRYKNRNERGKKSPYEYNSYR